MSNTVRCHCTATAWTGKTNNNYDKLHQEETAENSFQKAKKSKDGQKGKKCQKISRSKLPHLAC